MPYQLEEVLDWAVYLEHLQTVLKEFHPIATPNKETLICYFRETLRLSIQAQLDNHGRDLDTWNKMIEKAINAEAKTNFQPSSGTKEIDFRCPRSYKPSVKKDKDEVN